MAPNTLTLLSDGLWPLLVNLHVLWLLQPHSGVNTAKAGSKVHPPLSVHLNPDPPGKKSTYLRPTCEEALGGAVLSRLLSGPSQWLCSCQLDQGPTALTSLQGDPQEVARVLRQHPEHYLGFLPSFSYTAVPSNSASQEGISYTQCALQAANWSLCKAHVQLPFPSPFAGCPFSPPLSPSLAVRVWPHPVHGRSSL